MKIVKVPGKNNKNKVFMYALSTCWWCRQAKHLLESNEIEYDYVDVDLSNKEDREIIGKDILNKGGSLTFPTIIIDGKILIEGFRKDKIKEALKI